MLYTHTYEERGQTNVTTASTIEPPGHPPSSRFFSSANHTPSSVVRPDHYTLNNHHLTATPPSFTRPAFISMLGGRTTGQKAPNGPLSLPPSHRTSQGRIRPAGGRREWVLRQMCPLPPSPPLPPPRCLLTVAGELM